MNKQEFVEFIETCRQVFSAIDRMIEDSQKDRFRMWEKALEPVSAKLADEYVAAIVQGRVPAPRYPSDWDSFASECRVWCSAEEYRRNPPPPRQPVQVEKDRQSVFRAELRAQGGWLAALADRLDKQSPLPEATT